MDFLKESLDKVTHQGGGNHNEGDFKPEAGGHQYQTGVVPPTRPEEHGSGGGLMGKISGALGGGSSGGHNQGILSMIASFGI